MGLVIVAMKKHGFTLIELLVVISIIALLVSILMPALAKARDSAKSVYCLSNLRQFAIAAELYTNDNEGYYPIAYCNYVDSTNSRSYKVAWDFTHVKDTNTGQSWIESGLLWQGDQVPDEIQQCPSFRGKANWLSDPYTGYNYNTSYIGEPPNPPSIPYPTKAARVRRPGACALFGDGEYSGGANKFMRSPLIDNDDAALRDAYFVNRSAGTQGFRHNQATNAAYCDGRAATVRKCYKNTIPPELDNVAEGTGFLSEDNSAYDLR